MQEYLEGRKMSDVASNLGNLILYGKPNHLLQAMALHAAQKGR
jgi:hypothetical protein